MGREHLDRQALSQELDQAVEELNWEIPSRARGCKGLPPIAAHPELLDSKRPYHPALEDSLFDMQRVDAFLAQHTWARKVGKTGQVYLHDRAYCIGRKYARRQVLVCFDPMDRNFTFSLPDEPEVVLERRPIKGLFQDELIGSDTAGVNSIPVQLPLLWLTIAG